MLFIILETFNPNISSGFLVNIRCKQVEITDDKIIEIKKAIRRVTIFLLILLPIVILLLNQF